MNPTVHVLFENPAWLPPLTAALEAESLPYELVEVWRGVIPPDSEPAEGIYLNRMSPSSHTREHHESVALMSEMLAWLEHHGRTVINGSRAFSLEISKLRQHLALRRHGILTPATVLAVGTEQLRDAARALRGPFITKHNQGGKGLGIQLFQSVDELERHLDAGDYEPGPNGQMLVQQYIRPREPFITRVEIVDGRFLYAMRSDTSKGFELCPSDACQIQAAPEVCPADGNAKFSLSPLTEDDPLVQQYVELCRAEQIDVAGIEFVEDADGNRYTYDINGTTNYNSAVADASGVDGMREIARFLRRVGQRPAAAAE